MSRMIIIYSNQSVLYPKLAATTQYHRADAVLYWQQWLVIDVWFKSEGFSGPRAFWQGQSKLKKLPSFFPSPNWGSYLSKPSSLSQSLVLWTDCCRVSREGRLLLQALVHAFITSLPGFVTLLPFAKQLLPSLRQKQPFPISQGYTFSVINHKLFMVLSHMLCFRPMTIFQSLCCHLRLWIISNSSQSQAPLHTGSSHKLITSPASQDQDLAPSSVWFENKPILQF